MAATQRKATVEFPVPKTTRQPAKPRPTKAELAESANRAKLRRYAACGAGGVGIGMLGLSVYHCTEAIQALAPSYVVLSALLAIGIDAGMVASEAAELLAYDDPHVCRWARRYMVASVVLSMVLNGYANVTHGHTLSQQIFGGMLGIIVPALVFMLGKVAGYLAK